MTEAPPVYTVIVCHGDYPRLERCIGSLLETAHWPLKLAIVFNGCPIPKGFEEAGETLHSIFQFREPIHPYSASNVALFWKPKDWHFLRVDEHVVFEEAGWLEYWMRTILTRRKIGIVQLYPNWWERPRLTHEGEQFITHDLGLGALAQLCSEEVISDHGMYFDLFAPPKDYLCALEYVRRAENAGAMRFEDITTRYGYDGPWRKAEDFADDVLFFHRNKCIGADLLSPRIHNEPKHELYERIVCQSHCAVHGLG